MNKKRKTYIVLIFMINFILCNICIENIAFATPSETDNKIIILIDPGHGGVDGGAISKRGTLEKYINLDISLKLREKLKDLGYKVVMTREEDKGLYPMDPDINKMKFEDLNNRCKLKRDSNCDLFISIHQNFFYQSSCAGPEVWYSKNKASEKLAKTLQKNLNKDLGYSKRKEKEANGAYKILRCYSSIPSVIVECGFISNPEEEEKLKDQEYQNKIVDSIINSIEAYFLSQKI